MKWHHSRTPN